MTTGTATFMQPMKNVLFHGASDGVEFRVRYLEQSQSVVFEVMVDGQEGRHKEVQIPVATLQNLR